MPATADLTTTTCPPVARTRLDRRGLITVASLAVLGLALRVAYALAVVKRAPLIGDGLEFDGLARVISEGRGFVSPLLAPGAEPTPTAHKPPLYPLVLALASWLGGTGYVAHQVASAVLGTAAIVVVAALGGRLAGPRAAVIAAVIAAVYPVFVAFDASLRSESLYVLLIAASLLAAHAAWERPTWQRLAALGAVIGLAALTRSEGMALLVLLGVPVAWRRGAHRRVLAVAVLAGACAVVLAPWLVRCWIAFDQPVAISTSYGDLIAGANCDATYAGPLLGEWEFACVLGERGANEAVVADRLRSRGIRYARDHAGRVPAVVAARVLRPWGFYRPGGEVALHTAGEGRNATMTWLGLVAGWGLMILAVGGAILLRRRGQPLFILIAPFVLVVLLTATSYGTLRFRAAADVGLVVLSAVALDALASRAVTRRETR